MEYLVHVEKFGNIIYTGKKLDLTFQIKFQKMILLNTKNKVGKKWARCTSFQMLKKRLLFKLTQEKRLVKSSKFYNIDGFQ